MCLLDFIFLLEGGFLSQHCEAIEHIDIMVPYLVRVGVWVCVCVCVGGGGSLHALWMQIIPNGIDVYLGEEKLRWVDSIRHPSNIFTPD